MTQRQSLDVKLKINENVQRPYPGVPKGSCLYRRLTSLNEKRKETVATSLGVTGFVRKNLVLPGNLLCHPLCESSRYSI